MKPLELQQALQKGEIAPLYLLYGEETFLIDATLDDLKKRLIDPSLSSFNLTLFYGGETQPHHIISAAQTLPLLSKYRMVVVREAEQIKSPGKNFSAYCEQPLSSACLIFCSGSLTLKSDLLSLPFLDIASRLVCCGEQGLLSVAFPPGYASKRYFYVNYTRTPDGATVVARYRVSATDANVADPASEELILTIPQPFANHNGGQLAFGPDNNLYIGMGDGGSGGDPLNSGQRTTRFWGRSSGSTSNRERRPTRSPRTTRSSGSPESSRRSGRSGCGIRGASPSTA